VNGQAIQLQDVLDQDPEALLAEKDAQIAALQAELAEERAEKEQWIAAFQAEIAQLHRIIDDEPWGDDLFAKSQRIANPKEKLIAWAFRKVWPNVPLNADGLGESPATEISRLTNIPRASVLATLCRFGRMGLLNHPKPHKEPLFDEVTGEPILYKKGKRKGQQAWTSTSFCSPTDLFDDLSRWDAPPELEHKSSGYHPPKEKAPPIPTCPFCGEPATKEHSHFTCEAEHEWDVTRVFEREEDEESQSEFSDDLYDSDLAAICDQEEQDEEVPPPESPNADCAATLIKEGTQIAFSEGYEAGYQAQDEPITARLAPLDWHATLSAWLEKRIGEHIDGEKRIVAATGKLEYRRKYYYKPEYYTPDIAAYLRGDPEHIYGSRMDRANGSTWILTGDFDDKHPEHDRNHVEYMTDLAQVGIASLYFQRRPGRGHLEMYFTSPVDALAARQWIISIVPELATAEWHRDQLIGKV